MVIHNLDSFITFINFILVLQTVDATAFQSNSSDVSSDSANTEVPENWQDIPENKDINQLVYVLHNPVLVQDHGMASFQLSLVAYWRWQELLVGKLEVLIYYISEIIL